MHLLSFNEVSHSNCLVKHWSQFEWAHLTIFPSHLVQHIQKLLSHSYFPSPSWLFTSSATFPPLNVRQSVKTYFTMKLVFKIVLGGIPPDPYRHHIRSLALAHSTQGKHWHSTSKQFSHFADMHPYRYVSVKSDCSHTSNQKDGMMHNRALCRIKLLPVTHVLVDTWMLTVKPAYKLLNVSDDLKWTTNTHVTQFLLTFKA